MSDLQKVGPSFGGAGTFSPFTAGLSGQQRVSDAHGRFMQAALEGRLFSGGMGLTAISNVTFTTGTLGATGTPIAGVWNPLTSNKNLVILQAILGVTITAGTKTGGGPFAWAMSTGNGVLTLGSAPLNRLTMAKSGSVAKDLAGIAMTGQTNALVVMMGSALFGGSSGAYSQVDGTIAAPSNFQISSVENLDGSIIVPPGGILALLATTTPVAHSAVSGLVWEELPILTQG